MGCQSPSDQQYDQKNIRRRVYDALNVLMAMNIISKEKKEIRWLGLPTNSVQEATSLDIEKSKKIERIKAKTEQLQDLILQQIAFKKLVERNKEAEKAARRPTPNSVIEIPFIIVSTSNKTVIECGISQDKKEYLFDFDNTFEIHDDMFVLKKMNMAMGLEKPGGGQVSDDDLAKARSMVPQALEPYVEQLAKHGPGSYSMPKGTMPKEPRIKEDPESRLICLVWIRMMMMMTLSNSSPAPSLCQNRPSVRWRLPACLGGYLGAYLGAYSSAFLGG